jgi:putative aminopeptidase FrvX
LHLHHVGVPTIVLAAPVRYAHSHVGIVDWADVTALARLVWALVSRLDGAALDRLLPWGRG